MGKNTFIKFSILLFISVLCVSSTNHYNAHDKFNVLHYDGSQLLNEFLVKIANNQFENRRKRVSKALESTEDVKNYIENIRTDYLELVKIESNKTPLNARITGVIQCEDYRIEKVIFECRPDLHVTGNLYIPTFKKGPFPAVLEVCGHSDNGKAYESYQSLAILFAKNGFVVLVIDTYGQGERYQIYNSANNLIDLNSTVVHTQLDIGSMLVGSDIVSYQVWDNIRAIDYLCSRTEVVKEKIGVTGNSGGGTQTMFLMGLDSRIKVAAPSCGLQTRERMFTLNGPADGCHHIADEGIKMLEYSDYLILSAPKPILILAGEKDNLFDINAVSYTVREAKWFYKELGVLDRLDLFTVNSGHGYHKGLREACVWWFKKWLLNDSSPVTEPELILQNDEDLLVTMTGQVLNEFKQEKTIIDFNIQLANNFKNTRKAFWDNNSKQECILKIKELINYQECKDKRSIICTPSGELKVKGILFQKISITSRDGFPLPGFLYIPEDRDPSLPAALVIDSRGKHSLFEENSEFASLMESGRIIFAVDLRGFGETRDNPGELRKSWRTWNDEHRIAQTSLHIGRPLIGQRVQDVIDALDYLKAVPNLNIRDVELVGFDHGGLIALHAAAIDSRISSVKVIRSVSSWMDIIGEPLARNQLKNVVPGAMQVYDLPDLVNAIRPRSVEIIDPVDAVGRLMK